MICAPATIDIPQFQTVFASPELKMIHADSFGAVSSSKGYLDI